MSEKKISVFGSSLTTTSEKEYIDAVQAGECLAQQNFEVYSGGYGGIMEAVSLGSVRKGGKPVGVTCEIFGKNPPNRYIQKEIRCPSLYSRLETLVETADGYLIFPGSTGTMAEIILTIEVTSKFALCKPLIFWGEFWKDFMARIQEIAVIGDKRMPSHKTFAMNSLPIEYVCDCTGLSETLHKYFTG